MRFSIRLAAKEPRDASEGTKHYTFYPDRGFFAKSPYTVQKKKEKGIGG